MIVNSSKVCDLFISAAPETIIVPFLAPNKCLGLNIIEDPLCHCAKKSSKKGLEVVYFVFILGRWQLNLLMYNNETTKRNVKMKQPRETYRRKGEIADRLKITKEVTEDGIWDPDRRILFTEGGGGGGDKNVCRCRQGSL